MKPRRLTPELLDALPAEDPAAVASRRDLIALNRTMGHRARWTKWWRAEFPAHPPARIADLGTGDGSLITECLLGAFPSGADSECRLVDRAPCIPPERLAMLAQKGWRVRVVAADVFTWLEAAEPGFDAITANLFLHHFADADLSRLLAGAARISERFAALEPRRAWPSFAGVAALPLLGAHPVTRHDARVSVEAGFTAGEISALWPAGWCCEERRAWPFSHWFRARR